MVGVVAGKEKLGRDQENREIQQGDGCVDKEQAGEKAERKRVSARSS